MGQIHHQPVTTKESGNGCNPSKQLQWGYSCMQGWRISMEDAHFTLGDLGAADWSDTAAFGVMDGHGGEHVARFCERFLPPEISKGSTKDLCATLTAAFHRMDELLVERDTQVSLLGSSGGLIGKTPHKNADWMGCTANVCLIRPDSIIVANAGDSRAVLCRKGQAVPLSEDHKPNMPTERRRIAKAGGSVERQQVGSIVQYRVNGNLNLSRSIGDLEYKKNADLSPEEQMICSTPDVNTFPREQDDEFIVMGCDGIWDVIGNQDAVDFVRDKLQTGGRTLSGIAEDLLDHCISPDLSLTQGLGGDNMTVVIVVFLNSDSKTMPDQESRIAPDDSQGVIVPVVHVEGTADDAGMQFAAVEEGMILPHGLCGCKLQK